MPNTFERIGYQKGDQARGIQSSKDLFEDLELKRVEHVGMEDGE